MRHLVWSLMALATAIAVEASCIPDFQFRDERSASGAGGAGGAAGAGGAPVPMVPCGTNQWHVDCPPGDFCCYHETFYDCDTCTQMGQCVNMPACGDQLDYRIRRCNGPEDCPVGDQCCEEPTGDTACYQACSASQQIICGSGADCPPTQPACVEYVPDYTGYKHCST